MTLTISADGYGSTYHSLYVPGDTRCPLRGTWSPPAQHSCLRSLGAAKDKGYNTRSHLFHCSNIAACAAGKSLCDPLNRSILHRKRNFYSASHTYDCTQGCRIRIRGAFAGAQSDYHPGPPESFVADAGAHLPPTGPARPCHHLPTTRRLAQSCCIYPHKRRQVGGPSWKKI